MFQEFIKIRLSNQSREKILNVLSNLPLPTPFNLGEIQTAILQSINLLDKEVISEILKFKVGFLSAPFGTFLLIENCPIGELPSTPVNKGSFAKADYVSENFLILIGLILGYPIGYSAESENNLIDNIVAVKELAKTCSNAGFKVLLGYHVDLAHLPAIYSPDYTVLLTLRGDCEKKAKTLCISAKRIIEKLSDREVSILRKPFFKIEVPDSFKRLMKDTDYSLDCRPLLSGPLETPEIAFELNSTVAINDEAQAILDKLESICREDEIATEVVLKKGMILIIRNKSAVHARSPYNPHWDGNQRWLQRLYVVSDLWKMRDRLSSGGPLFQGVI